MSTVVVSSLAHTHDGEQGQAMHPYLLDVANGQRGLWTTRQALSAGYTEGQIATRVRSGQWTRIRRGCFTFADRPVTTETRARALVLVSPRPPVFSHDTAAALHGFDLRQDTAVHVAVDPGNWHARGAAGVVTHPVRDLTSSTLVVRGLRCTDPVRTVVDLAGSLPGHEGLAAADRAVRLGATSIDQLAGAADQGLLGRHGGARAGQVLRWADGEAQSAPESHMRWLFIDSPLVVPRPQTPVACGDRTHHVDLGLAIARLALEYDSDEHHADSRQRRIDRTRLSDMEVEEWTVCFVTPPELYRDRLGVLRLDADAVRGQGLDPVALRRRQPAGRYVGGDALSMISRRSA